MKGYSFKPNYMTFFFFFFFKENKKSYTNKRLDEKKDKPVTRYTQVPMRADASTQEFTIIKTSEKLALTV